jgi:hypothetical protein
VANYSPKWGTQKANEKVVVVCLQGMGTIGSQRKKEEEMEAGWEKNVRMCDVSKMKGGKGKGRTRRGSGSYLLLCLVYFITKPVYFSETMETSYQTTWHDIPVNHTYIISCCENVKSSVHSATDYFASYRFSFLLQEKSKTFLQIED